MRRLLIWFAGGGDTELTQPSGRMSRHVAFGAASLLSLLVSAIAFSSYALVANLPSWLTILLALVWLMMNVAINRWMAVGIGLIDSRVQLVASVLARLGISAVLGVVFSTCLMLVIFSGAITAKQVQAGQFDGTSILLRLQTLNKLEATEPGLRITFWALTVLVVILEALPALVSLVTWLAPRPSPRARLDMSAPMVGEEELRDILESHRAPTSQEKQYIDELADFLASLSAGPSGASQSRGSRADDEH